MAKGIIDATLASGEPIKIDAAKIAYMHPKGDKGCLIGFEGTAWIQTAESFDTMAKKWEKERGD